MRFMSIVKADKKFETGAPPDPRLFAAIGKLSEELMKAGILLDTGGLLPSALGARVSAKGGKVTVKTARSQRQRSSSEAMLSCR